VLVDMAEDVAGGPSAAECRARVSDVRSALLVINRVIRCVEALVVNCPWVNVEYQGWMNPSPGGARSNS
jgi:hypothetical protein